MGANNSIVSMRPSLLQSMSLKISWRAYLLLDNATISSGESNHSLIGAAPLRVIVITTCLKVSYVQPEHRSAKQSGMH